MPNPRGGWSQSTIVLQNATIVPPQEANGLVLEAGLFDADDAYCHHGAVWRRDTAITKPPKLPEKRETLKGKWLWGGVLYHHFGHFLVESTARLWALKRYRDEIDGIIFVPRNKETGGMLLKHEAEYLRLAAGSIPIKILTEPSHIEEVFVPGQGFGLGNIATGTRVFRRFMSQQFAQDIVANGSEKLFISRSKLGLKQGGFVGEQVLDARMEAAGYEVFWPEDHTISEQIARYKAATHVVSFDGSALHLFGMVAQKNQAVAMILRREPIASRSLRRQLQSFSKRKPVMIKALQEGSKVHHGKKRLISDLDFERIGAALKRHSFVHTSQEWPALRAEEFSTD